VANPIECQLLRTNTCDGCKVRPIYEAIAADYFAGEIDEPQASARTSKANKIAGEAGCQDIPNLRKIALAKANPGQANRAVFVIGKRGRGRETIKTWK
jgi:hypothetical protein